ncbi:hypothetical protein H7B90_30020 [Cohnella xylanilytica]|uniref:Uncharacterized protein n=1 Tax=Cohnella xylanilytica TaxID=557555 RepID=A0A841U4K8_9BACL|nr:hypothetical protein [Cohnella xylanilytica]MBB6695637.1 hypothetical protein [Cohnella xylanilytica]
MDIRIVGDRLVQLVDARRVLEAVLFPAEQEMGHVVVVEQGDREVLDRLVHVADVVVDLGEHLLVRFPLGGQADLLRIPISRHQRSQHDGHDQQVDREHDAEEVLAFPVLAKVFIHNTLTFRYVRPDWIRIVSLKLT